MDGVSFKDYIDVRISALNTAVDKALAALDQAATASAVRYSLIMSALGLLVAIATLAFVAIAGRSHIM